MKKSKSYKKNNKVCKKTNEKLWNSIKKKYIMSNKGGIKGKNSARKMQLATKEYKSKGGKYKNCNRKNTSMYKWTSEKWDYIPNSKPKKHYGRYLPEVVRKNLNKKEIKEELSRKKTKRGKWIKYSKSVNKKMKKYKIY